MSLLKERFEKKANQIGPITARIRPGIKVPTKAAINAAQSNPELAAIFRDVEEGRLAAREAEKRIIVLTNGSMKYPFTPKNTPYFNISAADFSAPELGGIGVVKLLDMYGEVREGTSGTHLWRIPMVFADVSDVEKIFPSEFRVSQGQNMYRSQYINGERHCMVRPPVEKVAHAKRRHQERTPQSRGLCDPESCAEFGSGACKFSGTLRFHIPGFPGIAPFVMGTTSTYAAEDIYFQLVQVIQKLGRIPRTKPDGSPVFWLVKSRKQRSYFDEDGQKKTGLQWVPDLVADLDFPMMLNASEQLAIAPPNPPIPQAWVAHEKSEPYKAKEEVTPTPEPTKAEGSWVQDQKGRESRFAQMARENGITNAVSWADLRFGLEWEKDERTASQACEVLGKLLQLGPELTTEIFDFKLLVLQHKMDDKLVDEFSKKRFGNRIYKDRSILVKAKAMLVEMLESGVDVAMAYMRAELAKAA